MFTAHKYRRQVKKLKKNLELSGSFDVALFCQRLAQKKGQQILLLSYPMPSELSGFWVRYVEGSLTLKLSRPFLFL
jgi:hypothetical protein